MPPHDLDRQGRLDQFAVERRFVVLFLVARLRVGGGQIERDEFGEAEEGDPFEGRFLIDADEACPPHIFAEQQQQGRDPGGVTGQPRRLIARPDEVHPRATRPGADQQLVPTAVRVDLEAEGQRIEE